MRPLSCLLALALLAGCGDPAPTCSVTANHELPLNLLTTLPAPRLDRVGAGFMLIGHDDLRGEVRFATVSEAGVMRSEHAVVVPDDRAAGPWYAVTAKDAPASQVLVLYGAAHASQPGAIALRMIVAPVNGPLARQLPARPVLDNDGKEIVLPAAPGPTGPALAFGSSTTGNRAILTWSAQPGTGAAPGATVSTSPPQVLLLGADGMPLPSPPALEQSGPFTCLAVTQSRLTFGISRVVLPLNADDRPAWLFAEGDDGGNIAGGFNYEVFTKTMGCPHIVARPAGYTFAWQNRVGTYFADAETTPAGVFFNSNIAKGAVRFGGPDQQPPIAGVASAGLDFVLTFDAQAPFTERFSRMGIQQGGRLPLPISRRIGTVAAHSKGDLTFATYLDQGPSATVRRLVKVECAGTSPKQE